MTIEQTAAPIDAARPALDGRAPTASTRSKPSSAKIWAAQNLTTDVDGEPGRRVSARTSVMNLVIIARRPEYAVRCASTMQLLTGRHPSRTIVIQSADPDGPSWLDARVEAHCILPRDGAAETCAETIHVVSGGEAGRHLAAIATPLIIHDLPVTVWWPGEPSLARPEAMDLLAGADRLIVDGSTWSGDGLGRPAGAGRRPGDDKAGDQRLRPRAPVALAGGDRLDLRRPGVPAVPALAAPDRDHLRDARRVRRARIRRTS